MTKPPPKRRADDMTADEVKQFWHGFCERKKVDPSIRARGVAPGMAFPRLLSSHTSCLIRSRSGEPGTKRRENESSG